MALKCHFLKLDAQAVQPDNMGRFVEVVKGLLERVRMETFLFCFCFRQMAPGAGLHGDWA